jgi:sulfocyanin
MGRLLFSACLVLASVAAAQAGDKITPSWMKIDAGQQSVAMEIVAGWNPENGSLNFNGFHDGQMTIVVPVGWKVSVHFINHDGSLPHSMLVTQTYPDGSFPPQIGEDQVAISRAYSRSPTTGIVGNEEDEVEFTTKSAGKFDLVCGAQGHALGGMWDQLEVSAEATAPYITLADGVSDGYR